VLGIVSTLAGPLAAVYGIYTSSKAFSEWQRRQLATLRMERAEKILIAAYEAELAFERIRYPLVPAAETQRIRRESSEDETGSKWLSSVYIARITEEKTQHQALISLIPSAKAYFRKELEINIRDLASKFHYLYTISEELSYYDQPSDRHRDILKEMKTKTAENSSNFDVSVSELISKIEVYCNPALKLSEF
jgi:uncharacterized protein (DUF2164 family)